MVLYFTSTAVEPSVTFYMGKDKFENEELLKYGLEQDIWFHVDKLSSAHVYLRLPAEIPDWEKIPDILLQECSQLVKANSIEGNKKTNLAIIYTPWSNIKVSFVTIATSRHIPIDILFYWLENGRHGNWSRDVLQ